ncbi:MAG: hypothetical protein F9K40_04835 [Kofleriaceae bacterium]|nr:MAG: hypothetical protein F9K40_04835 [Kofleriaceae bacterium]
MTRSRTGSTTTDARGRHALAPRRSRPVIGDEIAIADVLAVEAVRSLVPDVWSKLYSSRDLLTASEERTFRAAHRAQQDQAQFEELLKAAGEHRSAIQQFLSRVFPPCRRFIDNHQFGANWLKQWRKARRLAHPDILQFYFEKSLPPDLLQGQVVHDIYEKLGNEEALRAALASYDPTMVEHVLSRLEDYEDDFPASVVEPALVVVFEQYPRLREGRAGFADFGSSMAVTRIALRLLRRVKDEQEREAIARNVFGRLNTFSERYRLADLIARRDRTEERLVSPAVAGGLAEELQAQTVRATADALAGERDLLHLLQHVDDGSDAVPRLAKTWATNDRFFLRLLRSGLGDRTGFGLGNVAQKHEHTLAWEYLTDLLGEDLLVQRVDVLHAGRESMQLDERDAVALDTAVRYRAGWRPGRFIDDDDDEGVDEETPRERGMDSPEARAEKRLYGADTLLDLLGSVVPARRTVARDRIAYMVDNKVDVSEKVVGRLAEIAAFEDTSSEERVAAMDLVRRVGADRLLVAPLTRQWFTSGSITAEMSQRIAGLYHDHPDRAPQLLDALDRVALEGISAARVRDGILAVAYLFEHHAADLKDEISVRALKAVERFAGEEDLLAVIERAQKAHGGARS